MQKNQWVGQRGCRHYGGINKIVARVCCGGVVRERVKLKCAIHKHIYADACRKEVCGYYEKGAKQCPKKER